MTPHEQILVNTLDYLTKQMEALTKRVDKLIDENEGLRKENRNLAGIIENLKKAPVLEPIRTLPVSPLDKQTNWYPSCPKCGIKLDQVMGYVCSNHPCPTGLGGVYCSSHTEPSGPGR